MTSLLTMAVAVLFIIIGCGGGNSNNPPAATTNPLPTTIQAINEAYNNASLMLENMFAEDENGNNLQLNPEDFPDTKASLEIFPDLSARVIIRYKNELIYDETRGWGIYTHHGFTNDGTYIILVREYDPGDYSGESRIFINGEEILLDIPTITDIKEYAEWLILYSKIESTRSGEIEISWFLYNPKTKELLSFSDI